MKMFKSCILLLSLFAATVSYGAQIIPPGGAESDPVAIPALNNHTGSDPHKGSFDAISTVSIYVGGASAFNTISALGNVYFVNISTGVNINRDMAIPFIDADGGDRRVRLDAGDLFYNSTEQAFFASNVDMSSSNLAIGEVVVGESGYGGTRIGGGSDFTYNSSTKQMGIGASPSYNFHYQRSGNTDFVASNTTTGYVAFGLESGSEWTWIQQQSSSPGLEIDINGGTSPDYKFTTTTLDMKGNSISDVGGTSSFALISTTGAVKFGSILHVTGDITTTSFTRHHDIEVGAALFGASAPSIEIIGIARGLGFDANAETAYFTVEVPDDWIGTSDMDFSVDWSPDTAPTDTETVKWDISYRSVAVGEDIDGTSTTDITSTYTQSGAGTLGELISTSTTVDFDDATNPLTAGDLIFVEFTRDVTGDTFGEIPVVVNWNLAYESNTFAKH